MRELVLLQQVVKALERRFPDHNGPFEYGTRLAEETGELIEAIFEMEDDKPKKIHLAKEAQDVLRVVYGIAGLYDLTDRLPFGLADFNAGGDPKDPIRYMVQVGVYAGELANAINHAEGMGVKKEKHGYESAGRLLEKAQALAQVVVWTVRFFDCEDYLVDQINSSYDDYKAKGFIG